MQRVLGWSPSSPPAPANRVLLTRTLAHASAPKEPEKGVFPLDHYGECKAVMREYLGCLAGNGQDSTPCRELSRSYLECRMARDLMEKQPLDELGFYATADGSAPGAGKAGKAGEHGVDGGSGGDGGGGGGGEGAAGAGAGAGGRVGELPSAGYIGGMRYVDGVNTLKKNKQAEKAQQAAREGK